MVFSLKPEPPVVVIVLKFKPNWESVYLFALVKG